MQGLGPQLQARGKKIKSKKGSTEPVLEKKARGHLPPNKAKEILTLHQSGIN